MRKLVGAVVVPVAALLLIARSGVDALVVEGMEAGGHIGPVSTSVLAQEIVRLAQRSDIAEEVTRFRAHLEHWAALTASPEACGRKLDFLLQEMNREVNTMGSKADGARASELVIGTKAELERMREQVQNVE